MTAIWVIWAAVLLDLLIGDPRWLPHPVIGMGKVIRRVEGWIRHRATTAQGLKRAGILLPVIVAGGSFVLTWLLLLLCAAIHPWLAWGAEIVLIATTIAVKGLRDAGLEVYSHLCSGNLAKARYSLSMVVGRDTDHLDEPEVVRGTVETVAENIVDAVIAPLLFALIGGAPLAMAYRAVNTLDSMVGYKNEKYESLGWASARLDDIANWIPARLTAGLLTVVAAMFSLQWKQAIAMVKRDARKHPSPNSGFPESAVAGALGIRLGGENSYQGVISFRAYMGDPERALHAEHIRVTTRLLLGVSILFTVLGTAVLGLITAAGGALWL
ncbi:cobalamin biosynthesis protein CobD [Paenibacillus glucanolyticus]|jgi:adenosylcobinamide-phosphate synthase|nr:MULTISPECIES: adenosylcobinamide-phosphate synthase CbiB [Paenibacillus]ANA79145.1 adenosylcobinamide-phosphate synthase [Paenibacillus glucanolyticus]AVV56924.1 cobalamin biosynthesis protein CobD [Paenibacillus glucanolyticus]ETT39296.1 cobalamin biosynthesis protein CobD [Paenibacillus sp. FSL R5-808]